MSGPSPEFLAALNDAAARAQNTLENLLPPDEARIAKAMRYGVLNGGKRLRAFLVIEGARLFHVPEMQAERVAAAIECMHAYSLIHDDLPAMDDDDLRRGKPTVHRQWNDAVAILAGDALQALSFEILAHVHTNGDPAIRLKLITTLAQAAGAQGMVGGQDDDLAAETAKTPLDLDAITALQKKKTGALICWAAQAGPVLAKTDISPMTTFATNLGLAFQIHDDVLDVIGDPVKTGKKLRKDDDAGKATFVSLLGLETAQKTAAGLVEDACDALSPYSAGADRLRDCARFVISREA
jgi:farnesyl diphosphate synthase